MDDDFVWLHDYHLLVLPSLLRKRFNRIRLGLFLHSPFPSSEIFRTFPRREEILRSLLNADLLGAPSMTLLASLQSTPYLIWKATAVREAGIRNDEAGIGLAPCMTHSQPGEGRLLHSAWRGRIRHYRMHAILGCKTASMQQGYRNQSSSKLIEPVILLLQVSTRSTTRGTSCPAARACWGWSTWLPAAPSASSTTAAMWASKSCPQA